MARAVVVLTAAFALLSATGIRADLVWEYPFDELGGVWTSNGRWGQTADSAYIHRDRYIMGGGGGPETKTLAYHLYLVPYGVDSLTLDMDQTWSLTGYPISGGWGASIALTALVDGSDSHIIVYESATGSSSNAPAAAPGREHVQYTLPAVAGQDILFEFDAFTNLWGTISEVHLDWVVWNMTLTGHTPEALESVTWAAIKAVF
jgi:hypothetical protein